MKDSKDKKQAEVTLFGSPDDVAPTIELFGIQQNQASNQWRYKMFPSRIEFVMEASSDSYASAQIMPARDGKTRIAVFASNEAWPEVEPLWLALIEELQRLDWLTEPEPEADASPTTLAEFYRQKRGAKPQGCNVWLEYMLIIKGEDQGEGLTERARKENELYQLWLRLHKYEKPPKSWESDRTTWDRYRAEISAINERNGRADNSR